MEKLLKSIRAQIPAFGSLEKHIPELNGKDLSSIVVKTPDGKEHKVCETARKDFFRFVFVGKKSREITTIDIFESNKETRPVPVQSKIKKIVKTPFKKRSRFGFLNKIQDKQIARKELNQREIAEIRDKNLSHDGLAGKRALTFDHVGCWARALGMIQKAKQLQFQLSEPLYKVYQKISGQGDGAIIAAAIAAGIDLERLGQWWVTDWRRVHSPGAGQKIARWAVSKIKRNESGYNAKKARAALRKLFVKTTADLRMKDVLAELQITVIQADMNISTHFSPQNPEMELYTAVEDSAITKIHYNQKETIKGEAVFLGAIEKNDVAGLLLSKNNKDLEITSIGAPVRINPKGAGKLAKLGHAADKIALQSAGHFVYEKRVRQIINKLAEAGYNIRYQRLDCEPLDHVVSGDTSDAAMMAGIESGSGKISIIKEGGHENVG